MYFIATRAEPWTHEEFFTHGGTLAQEIVAWAGDELRHDRMLEIGCGIGRVLTHFAPFFERVDGIDIAPEMVDQARASGLPANVRVAVSSGGDLRGFHDDDVDFVFSYLVFQHIPEGAVIRSYLKEIRRILRPGGRAALQFDTRPKTVASGIASVLPDFMLPRSHRQYIRRYRRSRDEVLSMAGRAGLALGSERNPGTEAHFLLLRPA
jgi:SAM-dependent methyltransferase